MHRYGAMVTRNRRADGMANCNPIIGKDSGMTGIYGDVIGSPNSTRPNMKTT